MSDGNGGGIAGKARPVYYSKSTFFLKIQNKKNKTSSQAGYQSFTKVKQYLLSRMVGRFFCRIFLNFPLKSLGGNGSSGKLAVRPGTAPSRPSEQSASLSATSLRELSSKDMLDGGKPTASFFILLKKSFEAVPGIPSSFSFSFFLLPLSFSELCSRSQLCKDAASVASVSLLICFNPLHLSGQFSDLQ